MNKLLALTLMSLAMSTQAQVFEMGSDKGADKKNEIQDLKIDVEAIKKSPNAKAFDIKEELLFEQKETKNELKAIKPQEVKREPIANVKIEQPKKEVVSAEPIKNKVTTKEQMCYGETDGIVNLLGLTDKRKELIKTYLNSLCLKDVDVENYQKSYAVAKSENEQSILKLIKDYKIQSFNTIEQKLVHIKLLSLNSSLAEDDVYKVYSEVLGLYDNFLIQEGMAHFILSEELKSLKDKKLVKEIMNRLDQEQKNKQNNLSIRTIYYLNYIFSNGSYEKAKELDKKFIPKILDKTNKNVFLNEKLPQEECEYLQYAIPNVNLNKLKITCVVAELKKSQQ